MGNKKLSHDQKRRAKLKKRAEKSKKFESMAYRGRKYQAAEYALIVHRTEIGIYESYIMSDRLLLDADVEESIMELILKMRSGTPSTLTDQPNPPTSETDEDADEPVSLLEWNIRRNWRIHAERESLPPKDDLIGVLRSILASLEIRRSMAMNPQGYVRFLEEYMRKTGVKMEQVYLDEDLDDLED